MKTKFFIIIVTLFFISLADGTLYAKNKKSNLPHVLVIGIDGLGAHGLGMAKTPIMDELMKNGAYSLAARTVVPSSSGPAWSSMITGTTVERHGIGNNSWTVDNKLMEPVYKGDHNMFPTIFGEIRDRVPGAVIGAIYHWKSFGNFIEPDVCDLSISAGSEDEAAQKACDFLVEKLPNFTFVHLDGVDHGGHSGGYRSAEYIETIEKADSMVGVLLGKLKETGMFDNTVVFVIADHGGIEKTHGGTHPDEMIVPFIISGKGVKRGYEIKHPAFTYDLAPTIAWMFGLKLNEWVTGKPLMDAFSK